MLVIASGLLEYWIYELENTEISWKSLFEWYVHRGFGFALKVILLLEIFNNIKEKDDRKKD